MAIATAALALASLLARQESAERYESTAYGFRVDLPSGWTAREIAPAEDRVFTVSLSPPGSVGVPSFAVYVVETKPGYGAEKLRDAGAAKLESLEAREIERGDGRVAGLDAKLVSGRLEPAGLGEVLIRCHYFESHELLYCAQLGGGAEDEALAATLDAMLASFELFEPAPADARRSLAHLAERCWDAVPWCKSWEAAAARAKAEKRIVLVAFQNYAALGIASTLHTGPFLDPDLRALVLERFVPLRLGLHDDAPFREQEAFGISESAWGTSFLFVTAEGEVLRETAVSNASYLDDVARQVLDAHAKDFGKTSDGESTLDAAERSLRRGELDRAAKLIDGDDSDRAHRLRASLARRERKGEAALEALREAKRAGRSEAVRAVEADEAVVLMRMGRFAEAEERFHALVRDHESGERAAEALFYLGAFEVLRTGLETEPPLWLALIERHSDSLWAAKAAANLLKQGSFVHGVERLDWPEAALIECATLPAPERVAASRAREVERGCIDYLLATQRDDGTWWTPIDDFTIAQDLFSPATSAICAGSLVPDADDARVRRAVERTLAFLLERHRSGALSKGGGLEGTYSIWRRTYALWLVARCKVARIGDAQELARAMDELAASVCANQHKGGGWPYVFFPGDPDGSAMDPSASFLTAAVVLALLDAREAGANTPQEPLERALAFLAALRDEDGTYRYMPAIGGGVVDGSHPEAGGRGPVCALALRRGGKIDGDRVSEALDLFVRHRPGFANTWRKELCHTGPQAQGAHYLFFDHYYACAATRALPPNERARYRDALLDEILGARLADGSFADLPSLGRPYGTAMALMSLRALRGE